MSDATNPTGQNSESSGEPIGANQPLRAPLSPEQRAARKYVPAVSPGLKKLLYVVFILLALLGANSVYLFSLRIMGWVSNLDYENSFSLLMYLAHIILGLIFILPFVLFGFIHMVTAWNRKNRQAKRVGYALFIISLIVLVTGVLLIRIEGLPDLKDVTSRQAVYWTHVILPLFAGWLYWLHRLAGPKIKWRIGMGYAVVVAVFVIGMGLMHGQDPRKWSQADPKDGEMYFHPSLARTVGNKLIAADTLMMDDYCKKCHPDIHRDFYKSVHKFSSFNNQPYLTSVRETREHSMKHQNDVKSARWCAGCHDPVPFFSGAFDDPKFDDVRHPTAHAGITCTVCHSIIHINSEAEPRGNADYIIEEPLHYPFAYSTNPLLQWVNNQLVKAKPEFHKKTFLKPLHKTSEFCATCHKVHLPKELNHYKDFLRGQNHYDTFLLSGVSGHGARSFYYPEKASKNCSSCHMPLVPSNDFGAKMNDDSKKLTVHNHLFPGANTGIAYMRGDTDTVKVHQEFLQKITRIDIFGIREDGAIDGKLTAPLRPENPVLQPGKKYLLELVVRTLKIGHHLTQGTADSNELWVDVVMKSGDRVIGRSGAIDETEQVDPYSHFINVYMLDRKGNRIDRRNPQDIFVPLYDHQIPPGAGQVVHYEFEVPKDLKAPITVEAELKYRKFDKKYMDYVRTRMKKDDLPMAGIDLSKVEKVNLPITVMAKDSISLPVAGLAVQPTNSPSPIKDSWQRWNDYGIGLLLEGVTKGGKGNLKQAEFAFKELEKTGRFDGPLNLARVYIAEGRLDEAVTALNRAADKKEPPAPTWTLAWLNGQVNRQQGNIPDAIRNFEQVLQPPTADMVKRGFDFRLDYEVIKDLGLSYYDMAKTKHGESKREERLKFLNLAREQYERVVKTLDSEDMASHWNLYQIYAELGDEKKAETHRQLFERFRPDEEARSTAHQNARLASEAANRAAERIVTYPLQRKGAPGLAPAAQAKVEEKPAKPDAAAIRNTSAPIQK